MFKKEDSGLLSDKINTVIGKDTVFNGTINGKDVIRIDGKLEGNITSQNDVVVGEGGHVSAEIKAKNITVAGQFEGTLEASGRVEIKRTGKVVGTFIANSFMVEDGSTLSGNLDMIDKKRSGKTFEQAGQNFDAAESGLKDTVKM